MATSGCFKSSCVTEQSPQTSVLERSAIQSNPSNVLDTLHHWVGTGPTLEQSADEYRRHTWETESDKRHPDDIQKRSSRRDARAMPHRHQGLS